MASELVDLVEKVNNTRLSLVIPLIKELQRFLSLPTPGHARSFLFLHFQSFNQNPDARPLLKAVEDLLRSDADDTSVRAEAATFDFLLAASNLEPVLCADDIGLSLARVHDIRTAIRKLNGCLDGNAEPRPPATGRPRCIDDASTFERQQLENANNYRTALVSGDHFARILEQAGILMAAICHARSQGSATKVDIDDRRVDFTELTTLVVPNQASELATARN